MPHCSSFVTLAQKLGSFDRDIKNKLKIMSLEVDSAYQTECSMKAIRNGYGLLCAAALLVLLVLQYATMSCIKNAVFTNVSLRFYEF